MKNASLWGVIFTLFRHYLFSRRSTALIRTISWLCVGGVAVGVLAMVVVLSIMNGFDGAIESRLLSVEPHLVVKLPAMDQEKDALAIAGGEPGAHAHGYESQDVLLRTVEGVYGGAVARGVDPDVLKAVLQHVQAEDKKQRDGAANAIPLEANDVATESYSLKKNEVIIGIDLAHSLGLFEGDEAVLVSPESLLLPPGETIPFVKVKISSIVRTSVPDVDAQSVYYNRAFPFKALVKFATVEHGIEVRLDRPHEFGGLKTRFTDKGFVVQSWEDRNSALFYSLKMEKLAMGLFLGLSVLIGSFSILSVLVLLVTQKRADIGILMAMGMSPEKTRRVFTGVGVLLSGLGLFGGLAVGLLICWFVAVYPFTLPDIYYDTRIPVKIQFEVIAGIAFGSALLAFIAAWVPARNATKITPAEAIRPALSK